MKNQILFQSIIFSLLMIASGIFGLKHDFTYAAIFASFAAVFSSANVTWQELANPLKIMISVSTIFGVGALIYGILF